MTPERLRFLLAVLAAAAVVALVRRWSRPLATHLGKLDRFLLPALGLAALGIFAKIAGEVREEETSALDRAISLAVHRLDSPVMDLAMRAFTALGSFPVIVAVVVAASAWRIRHHDKPGAAMLIGVTGVTELLNLALKETFQRARPSLFTEIATLHSYSFPSGHAMASTAVYGAIAVLAGKAYPDRRRAFGVGIAVLVLLIGFSRIYLGVHWFTDVIAGIIAGLFVLLAGAWALEATERRVRAGSK